MSAYELNTRVCFAANYLLILRTQGRISYQEECVHRYNLVISRFIGILSETLNETSTFETSVNMIAFYMAFGILGSDE